MAELVSLVQVNNTNWSLLELNMSVEVDRVLPKAQLTARLAGQFLAKFRATYPNTIIPIARFTDYTNGEITLGWYTNDINTMFSINILDNEFINLYHYPQGVAIKLEKVTMQHPLLLTMLETYQIEQT